MSFKWDYTQVFITTPSTEQELGNISSYVLLPLWEFRFSPWRTEFKTIIPTRSKTVGVKSTSDSLGVSRRRRAQTPRTWYGFRPQSCLPVSISLRKAWLVALELIGTIRDNDFPVHTPSEQLLFKYFPYSSFTGKQYLIEISRGRH